MIKDLSPPLPYSKCRLLKLAAGGSGCDGGRAVVGRRGICVNGSGLLFRSVSFSGLAQTLIFPEGEQRNKIASLNMTRHGCGRGGADSEVPSEKGKS